MQTRRTVLNAAAGMAIDRKRTQLPGRARWIFLNNSSAKYRRSRPTPDKSKTSAMLKKSSHAACVRVAAIFLAVLATSAVFAAESKVLNIGWTGGSAWTALPDRIAAERGFFEKEGLRVRYIQFQGTNLMLSALMANELDYVTILPFIAGAATRGLPVKIVGTTAKSSGYAIISRPEIDSVKALKGKRIAINTFGSSADFAIYQLLSRNGLDPNK